MVLCFKQETVSVFANLVVLTLLLSTFNSCSIDKINIYIINKYTRITTAIAYFYRRYISVFYYPARPLKWRHWRTKYVPQKSSLHLRDAMLARVLAVGLFISVSLSVRPSVTGRYFSPFHGAIAVPCHALSLLLLLLSWTSNAACAVAIAGVRLATPGDWQCNGGSQ